MATIQREVRKRGLFGRIFKWLFIIFNLVMVVWVVMGLVSVGDVINETTSEAEQAGAAIGGTIGVGILLFFWAAGDLILGMLTMFTRGPRVLITEEQ